jgi:hypothetical protein
LSSHIQARFFGCDCPAVIGSKGRIYIFVEKGFSVLLLAGCLSESVSLN